MKTLIMDTSNTYLVVGLYKDGQCLAKIQEKGNRKQSENALLYTKRVLEENNMTMQELDEMVITIGPGSYTGVRVALTIAKTLGTLTDVNIKVVSSLLAYAGKEKAISILDARSKKVFVAVYNNASALLEEQLISIEEIDAIVANYPDYDIVGDLENAKEVDLVHNIYLVSRDIEPITNLDALVPTYIKEVEAKKLCL